MRKCFLCGGKAVARHHIFGGALRRKSDRYGLVVDLCHHCHNEPPNGAHFNLQVAQALHEYGQRKAMKENNWTVADFQREFYKNYI